MKTKQKLKKQKKEKRKILPTVCLPHTLLSR